MTSYDYLGDKAANFRLINMITTYWRKRGFHVKAWVERGNDSSNGAAIFVVRTDIRQDVTKIDPTYTTI